MRKELVEVVEAAGRVMTAHEAAVELRVRHGAGNDTPERTLGKSLAVVRAAVEAEMWEGEGAEQHEALLAVHRRGETVLIAAESLPGTDDPSPRELADYATELGAAAERLARQEPLPGRAAVVRELRAVAPPDGFVPLADTRLVALAAAVAPMIEVTPRLELYPRDLTLERALRISQAGAGVRRDRGITVAELVTRLRARFPDLDVLSGDREPTHVELESVLADARFDLSYDTKSSAFFPPALESAVSWTSTGTHTSYLPYAARVPVLGDAPFDPHEVIRAKLAVCVERGGFLALTVWASRLPGAAQAVAASYPVDSADLGREFQAEFRALAAEKGQDWEKVLRADAGSAPGQIKRGLASFVRVVWPRVEARLLARAAAPRTVLFLQNAGLLARYWDEGGHDTLVRLQAAARRPADDPHGLWLLCPMEVRSRMPQLDGKTVEVIGGDGEWVYLDSKFLDSLAGEQEKEEAY